MSDLVSESMINVDFYFFNKFKPKQNHREMAERKPVTNLFQNRNR